MDLSAFVRVPRGKVGDCKSARDFGGIMRTVTFRSELPLMLAGIQFFGLKCGKCKTHELCNLQCYIEVSESLVHQKPMDALEVYLPEAKYVVKYGRDHLDEFPVIFPKPVAIPEKTWVDISFDLAEGMKLHCLPDKALNATELVSEDKTVEISILRGSRQVSAFLFAKEP